MRESFEGLKELKYAVGDSVETAICSHSEFQSLFEKIKFVGGSLWL